MMLPTSIPQTPTKKKTPSIATNAKMLDMVWKIPKIDNDMLLQGLKTDLGIKDLKGFATLEENDIRDCDKISKVQCRSMIWAQNYLHLSDRIQDDMDLANIVHIVESAQHTINMSTTPSMKDNGAHLIAEKLKDCSGDPKDWKKW